MLKVTWLGQAGLLFENDNTIILVDPYLSDSVAEVNPLNRRKVPVDEKLFDIVPDVLICTHNHLDHLDPQTLQHYLKNNNHSVTVLSPESGWQELRKFGGNNNYVKFNRHTIWTFNNIIFTAVKAEHTDIHPIGVIIDDGDKKYYITGDTLYNKEIFNDLPKDIDALFLPINGTGNNMNMTDASRFAKKVGAKATIPLHFGLFDEINPENFDCENKIIPFIYKEIKL